MNTLTKVKINKWKFRFHKGPGLAKCLTEVPVWMCQRDNEAKSPLPPVFVEGSWYITQPSFFFQLLTRRRRVLSNNAVDCHCIYIESEQRGHARRCRQLKIKTVGRYIYSYGKWDLVIIFVRIAWNCLQRICNHGLLGLSWALFSVACQQYIC